MITEQAVPAEIEPWPSAIVPRRVEARSAVLVAAAGMTLLLLAAFGLRLIALGRDSLWYDETYSVYMARHGVAAISTELFGDHVPLHYYLLDGWIRLAGATEYASRFLSVVSGVACVPLLWQFLRRLGLERKASLLGAGILAVAGLHVYYSQEARPHMLACFFCLAAAYALLKAARRGEARWWAAYGLLAVASLYTFYYSALVLLAINLPILVRARSRGWWLANSAAVATLIPWLVTSRERIAVFLAQRTGHPAQPDLAQGWHTVVTFAFGPTGANPVGNVAAALLLALIAVGIVQLIRQESLAGWMAASYALVPIVALYAITFATVRLPVTSPRYLLLALPGCIALLVLASRQAGTRWIVPAACLIACVPTAIGLWDNATKTVVERDDYRALFATVDMQAFPDEALVYDVPDQYTALDYYWPRPTIPAIGLDSDSQLPALARQYQGFWAVLYGEPNPSVEPWLDSHAVSTFDHWYGPLVRLKHYRLATADNLAGAQPVEASFGPLTLRQLTAGPLASGGQMKITLLWQLRQPTAADYTISLQLFDDEGQRVVQSDAQPFDGGLSVSRWQAGQSYEDVRTLALPALRPGVYDLRASVYDSASRSPAGDQQLVARVSYLPAARTVPVEAVSDDGWQLSSVAIGDTGVVVNGHVSQPPERSFTWFVHVLDADDRLLSQDDHPPLAEPSAWQPGDPIAEPFRVTVPNSAARLEIGAYDASAQRIPIVIAGQERDVISIPLSTRPLQG